jgi:hypothetical protein
MDFGAKGDGVTDDTAAFIAAFAFANTKLINGLVSTIKNSVCTVYIPDGVYSLATLSSPIAIKCNVEGEGAQLLIPAAYAQDVIRVGLDTAVDNLADISAKLPSIYKPTGSAIIAGSTAVRLLNLNASKITLGRISYFESGLWCGGIGEGTVYCHIWIGQINYCKRSVVLKPDVNGWCNTNTFYGGNIQSSSGFAGGARAAGWRHLVIDGRSPATTVVGNTFIGTSWEGNAPEYIFEVYAAYNNTWLGNYHETGAPIVPVVITGDTVIKVNHGLSVGDKLFMSATSLPIGMSGDIYDTGYYVVSVVDADNFKVSLKKGGTAITFGTSGSGVYFVLAGRFVFDSGAKACFSNMFINLLMPTSLAIDVIEQGVAYSNGLISLMRDQRHAYNQEDTPLYSAGNAYSSAPIRPLFAAHPPSSNPKIDPKGWTAALSDRGLIFGDGVGSEVGQVFRSNITGALKYRNVGDAATGFDLASCTRSPALIPVTSVVCPANSRTTTTITLTGAALGDHLTLTPYDLLPDGIVIAWARINAANTVQIAFQNVTGSSITITSCNFQAMATRRYY